MIAERTGPDQADGTEPYTLVTALAAPPAAAAQPGREQIRKAATSLFSTLAFIA
jgi:hypothetical protein